MRRPVWFRRGGRRQNYMHQMKRVSYGLGINGLGVNGLGISMVMVFYIHQ